MSAPEQARLTQPEMSQCRTERELSHAATDKAWDMARQEAKEAAAGLVIGGDMLASELDSALEYLADQDNAVATVLRSDFQASLKQWLDIRATWNKYLEAADG